MARTCLVELCGQKYVAKGNNVTFFKFPSDPALREKWLHALITLNKQQNIANMDKPSYLCELHFEENCIEKIGFGPRRLKHKSVPTKFPRLKHKSVPTKFPRQSEMYPEEKLIKMDLNPKYQIEESESETETDDFLPVRCFETVSMFGDGNCPFRAIAHCVYNRQEDHKIVRNLIVDHICNNWNEFHVLSSTLGEDNYASADEYREKMSLHGTYGTLREVVAAGQIFSFVFEVWRDGSLYHTTPNLGNDLPSKMLDLSGKIFDVLKEKRVWEDTGCQDIQKKYKMRDKKNQDKKQHEKAKMNKMKNRIRIARYRERLKEDRVRHATAKGKETDKLRKRKKRKTQKMRTQKAKD